MLAEATQRQRPEMGEKVRQLRMVAKGMPCSLQDPRVSLGSPRTCSLIFSELYHLPPCQSSSALKKNLR